MTDPNYTHLLLVADRSGSMMSIEKDMNGGIATLLADQAKEPGTLLVDAWTFDTTVQKVADNAEPNDPKLAHLVNPRGGTAMFDGIGQAVTDLGAHLAALPEDKRPSKVVTVIVTDGAENASREWSGEMVRQLVTQQQEQYGWEFVFLGANIDSATVGGRIGLSKSRTIDYAASTHGAEHVMSSTSSLISGYRSAPVGASVQGFTEEDRKNAKGE